jgi:hypothetical protein
MEIPVERIARWQPRLLCPIFRLRTDRHQEEIEQTWQLT